MKYLAILLVITLAGCIFHRQMYLHVTGDKFLSPYGTLNNAEINYNATTDYSFDCARSAGNTSK